MFTWNRRYENIEYFDWILLLVLKIFQSTVTGRVMKLDKLWLLIGHNKRARHRSENEPE